MRSPLAQFICPPEFQGCERLAFFFFFVFFLKKKKLSFGEGKEDALDGRDTTACAPTLAPATITQPTVLKEGCSPWRFRRPLTMALHPSSSSRWWTKRQDTAPILQSCDSVGKLRGRICLGERPMHRHRSLPAVGLSLPARSRRRVPDQPYYPGSSRLVCHSRSGPMRAGSPPIHQDRGERCSSVLALIGGRSVALHLGFAKRPFCGVAVLAGLYPWRLKGQNKCASAVDGLPPTSLSPQQSFRSSPTLGSVVSLGAQHAKEKKEVLDGRCVVSLGLKFRPAVRERTRSRISRGTNPPRRGTQRRRQTVPTAISATGDFLRAQTVQGGRTGQAFCADQTGFTCAGLQKTNARSSRFESSLPFLGAAHANISHQGSSPRRVGPCWPQCFSTNSAGGQNQSRSGAWAERTEPGPGAQTVSTTQMRTAGHCVGKRTQNGREAAPRPSVSLCFSCLRASAASVCE